jgi:hypothetical protein
VWELKRADPGSGFGDLYGRALRIGRDHIASTVNTLVLAYAGASLPLLLLFTQAEQGLGDVLNGEAVAVEVVRTLCGSIGLVAAVPFTTALAALVVGGGMPSSAATAPAGGEGGGAGEHRTSRPGWRPSLRRSTDERTGRSRRERRFWDEP